MTELIHEPKHQHEIDAANASAKHPHTYSDDSVSHHDRARGHVADQIETHHLLKGHHEESSDGKPKNPTHSGVNPQKDEAERTEENEKHLAIRQVDELEKQEKAAVADGSNKLADEHHSHTSEKKDLTDTVYNFVK